MSRDAVACQLDDASCCGPREPVDWSVWWRIGAGVVVAVNSMTVSLAVNTSEMPSGERTVVHVVLLGLTLASLVLLGWPLARNAWRELIRRRITIEAMFLAGIVGATVASLVAMLTGEGEVYFEIVSILLVVYAFGQQVSNRAQERALRAADAWAPGMSTCTILDPDGSTREIPAEELQAGQLVAVSPGASIAADGEVIRGEAYVREAEMTGEHFAVVKRPGDIVWAGTHCVDASLVVRATSDGGHRRIDAIVEVIERARTAPSSLQRQADRLVSFFLPVVATVATVTFLAWAPVVGWPRALFNAMAVLLVACPCALGLATPLAVWAVVGRLAGRGLVVRSGEAVEELAAATAAVFDKTGTLTEPRTTLVDLVVHVPEGWTEEDLLAALEAVERATSHPVAAAFHDLVEPSLLPVVESLRVLPGAGVEARVGRRQESSVTMVVGDPGRLGVEGRWQSLRQRLHAAPGAREVGVLVNGTPAAAAIVDERLRSSWPEALAELRRDGIATVVLTGDRAERARHAEADRVTAELGPEDKVDEVRGLQASGARVAFIGDGVNDAAAMAAANVGVAVAGGAELAEEVGSVVWHGGDLRVLPWALRLARRTVRVIRSNLALAVSYNAVGMALAVAGVLHPVVATVLMTCSSLVVTWRAMAVLQEEQVEQEASAVAVARERGLGEEAAA